MIVELGWFVVRPIYIEILALKSRKSELRPKWFALMFVVALFLFFFWIWILATSVRSPALMTAKNEFYIQAPFASYLTQLKAINGQQVIEGEELIVLLSPEAVLGLNTAEISRLALFEELQRTAANSQSRERTNSLQSQLARAEGSTRLSLRESDLLRLRAPGAGVVRDVLPNTATGRWIRSRELLMRVVSENHAVIHAYVDESSVYQLHIGARATF
jgi:putative peptide zinc metalloprotease protein